MNQNVCENIMKTCESLGEAKIANIPFESADQKLLVLDDANFDEHVSMQPAAIAFYGSMRKEAERRLGAAEKSYKRWEKRKYAETKARGPAKTVEDIRCQYVTDHEVEIDKMEEEIGVLQAEFDTLDVWYEAWRTKGFAIHNRAGMLNDDFYSVSSISPKENTSGGSGYGLSSGSKSGGREKKSEVETQRGARIKQMMRNKE